MSTLLRVDSSFRTEGSTSRAVADSAEAAWLESNPTGTVVRRDLGAHPLPAEAWGLAVGAKFTPEAEHSREQRDAAALATTLASEIIDADAVLIATPLYNFGLSQFVKVWIDLLIADPRLGPGTTALNGKPTVLIVVQGGSYRDGTPREGWDHASPYLQRILVDVFGVDLSTVTAELTLAGVNPALADFIGIAEQSLATAHAEASRHGSSLAERLEASI